jgi:tetratricopeptide (TPR) repeat protein
MCTRLSVVAFFLLLAPGSSQAQVDQVVLAGRELITAAADGGQEGHERLRSSAVALGQALAELDRAIERVEVSARRELPEAQPLRAFQLHVELGRIYRTRGRLRDAIREFDAASILEPNHSDLQLLRALTHEAGGDANAAIDAFRIAWQRDPDDPTKAYHALRRRSLTTAADRARALTVLEDAYRRISGNDSRPASSPSAQVELLPDWASAMPIVGDERTAHGFALFAGGQYSEGVAALTRDSPDPLAPAASALAHFVHAQQREAAGEPAEARRAYAAALPGTLVGRSTIYSAIGRLALVEGDVAAALDAYRHAVRLNPTAATTRLELANAYVVDGSIDDAVAEVLGGLLLNPTDPQLHAGLGQLRLDAGRPADAIPALTRALELNPDRYELRYALATAFTRTARPAEAAMQLQLFERVRRELLTRRRAAIQQEVEKEKAARRSVKDSATQ